MLEPVGPLAPSVYWRRRATALAVVLLVVIGIWAIAASAGGDEPVAGDPRPASLASPDGPSAPGPIAAALPGGPDLAVPPGAPADPAAALAAPPGGDGFRGVLPPAPSTTPTTSSTPPSTPTTPSTPPATTTPATPPTCADDVVRVVARTDRPRYAAGERPQFSLVVTNTGSVPCVRDLDAARQAVAVVRSAGDGLWGSNDCSPGDTDDVRTLAPGEEAVFSLRWSGRTSAPGCAGARTVVPPGDYQLLARLDGLVSEPARFTLAE